MATFVFTVYAKKRFLKLDASVRKRILLKLQDMKSRHDFGTLLKLLSNFDPATHRLRLGDYRLILRKEDADRFLVLDIGHRKDVYR